ncbi:aldo/keto reductase [Streptomyces sp. CBMA29]|uniref:aldo/keto reductase n=1 Tax=Streptomyces sp. CBMA29 TaxID=1896314 RepID=UPI0016620B7A|nr:aldo/keto reductase [Streptomyces sp. CBMA29]MBD0735691.1 L-glyceraldehyde 3-phosphate reductase [Streptomyces sp. CBMA29]
MKPPPYRAADDRYSDGAQYQRCGRSGVLLPKVSLGLWHRFGDTTPLESQRDVLRRAFDLGVTHFDLANNYGPPYGAAEANFGTLFAQDFRPYRDELVISTKAGYDMWPGPYGEWGSRKHLLSSLDQSLSRMGLDHVDIFYSHRFDPDTPLEETMGALATAVQQGKALYVGLSNYAPEDMTRAAELLRDLRTPLLINQHAYNVLDRTIEENGLIAASTAAGAGVIAFSPLAQGQLTDRYLEGVPADSRAAIGHFLKREALTEEKIALLHRLNAFARDRGQTLAQLALAWVLRDERVTSVLIGASSVTQLDQNLGALDAPPFDAAELAALDALVG